MSQFTINDECHKIAANVKDRQHPTDHENGGPDAFIGVQDQIGRPNGTQNIDGDPDRIAHCVLIRDDGKTNNADDEHRNQQQNAENDFVPRFGLCNGSHGHIIPCKGKRMYTVTRD
jgi:hypothetical protein